MRSSREFSAELILPSFARVYGGKRKHVIEPRAYYRYVNGIDNFHSFILFDETELLSNTNELEVSLTNRLFTKEKDGRVEDTLSWTVAHRRFFDPTFGGALVDGQRNVLLSSATLTGYSFLDMARRYSPISSVLRARAFAGSHLGMARRLRSSARAYHEQQLHGRPALQEQHLYLGRSQPGPKRAVSLAESQPALLFVWLWTGERERFQRARICRLRLSETDHAALAGAVFLQHGLLRIQCAISPVQFRRSKRKPVSRGVRDREYRIVRNAAHDRNECSSWRLRSPPKPAPSRPSVSPVKLASHPEAVSSAMSRLYS